MTTTLAPTGWPTDLLPLDPTTTEGGSHAVPADLIELHEILEYVGKIEPVAAPRALRRAPSVAGVALDRFVPRSGPGGWGARPRKSATGIEPTFGSTVHYEGPKLGSFPHESCAPKVRAIQAYHMDQRGWADIAYSSVECPHGYIFEGRWIGRRTGANGTNVGNATAYAHCALIGVGDPATPLLVDAIARVCEFFRTHGRAGRRVNGHRDWKPTACPGDPLYLEVKVGTFTRPTGSIPPPVEPDDEEWLVGAQQDIEAKIEAEANKVISYLDRLGEEDKNATLAFIFRGLFGEEADGDDAILDRVITKRVEEVVARDVLPVLAEIRDRLPAKKVSAAKKAAAPSDG